MAALSSHPVATSRASLTARHKEVVMRFVKLVCSAIAAWSVAASSNSTIYRCEAGATTTFSDRPCDESARLYTPDSSRISTYEAPPAAPVVDRGRKQSKPRKARVSARSGGVDSAAKRAAACDKVQNALKDIRARMRAGYSAKQGERLREQEQTLKLRWRADKCR
jgi:hypothetical protein